MDIRDENITFVTTKDPQKLEEAAALIDAYSQRRRPVKRERFHAAQIVALALNERGQVVGVGVTRKAKKNVAEAGYVAVHPDYRRRGIAERLAHIRIEEARKQGIDLLYGRTASTNVASLRLSEKLGFQLWGKYRSRHRPDEILVWSYFPLSPTVNAGESMRQKTAGLTPVE